MERFEMLPAQNNTMLPLFLWYGQGEPFRVKIVGRLEKFG